MQAGRRGVPSGWRRPRPRKAQSVKRVEVLVHGRRRGLLGCQLPASPPAAQLTQKWMTKGKRKRDREGGREQIVQVCCARRVPRLQDVLGRLRPPAKGDGDSSIRTKRQVEPCDRTKDHGDIWVPPRDELSRSAARYGRLVHGVRLDRLAH